MNRFIDIHSHQLDSGLNEDIVVSIWNPLDELELPRGPFFAGIHPWSSEKISEIDWRKKLQQALLLSNCLGLGEVGLDRSARPLWENQKEIFEEQLNLAASLCVKGVVIHAVRSYDEIWKIIRNYKFLYLIWHDFNGNEDTIKKLIKDPRNFFSFGSVLFRSNSKLKKNFDLIPKDRFFLESDNSGRRIRDVYGQASSLFGIDDDSLVSQIEKNWFKLMRADF